MHDGPIQELTAAQLFLDGLALRMESQQVDPALRESLARGLGALRNATAGCRQLMDSLRPGLEGEGELAERFRRLAAEVSPGGETVVSVDVPSGFGRAVPDVALALYRTLEDALDQTRRGRGTVREITLAARAGAVELRVTVEPPPFDIASPELAPAARRITGLDGTMDVDAGGRTLVVTLPAHDKVP